MLLYSLGNVIFYPLYTEPGVATSAYGKTGYHGLADHETTLTNTIDRGVFI